MDLESAKKYVIVFAAIGVVLPVVFVLTGQPDDPTATAAIEAIRENTHDRESPAGVIDDPVALVRTESGYALPAGWTVDDPFTNQSRYWPEYALVSQAKSRTGSRRVLLRSQLAQQTQIFLIAGPADALLGELVSKLDERKKHPLRTRWNPASIRSADGVELNVVVHGIREGLLAGNAVEHVSGFSKKDDLALLVDAGGAAESFDSEVVLRVLRELEVRPLLDSLR